MGMVHVYTGGDPHDDLAIALDPQRWVELVELLEGLDLEGADYEVRARIVGIVREGLAGSQRSS